MDWQPPDHWTRITTLDAHEPPENRCVSYWTDSRNYPARQSCKKRQYAREHYDHLRKALMWEPRGHPDMYGCIFTPPVTPDGDVGVLFMHNEGYSTMCGHGIIGMVKVGIETGMFKTRRHQDRHTPPDASPRQRT